MEHSIVENYSLYDWHHLPAGRLYPVTVAYYDVSVGVGLTGWRVQILLTAVPYVLMLILMHFMDESPRYLAITSKLLAMMNYLSTSEI